MAIKIFKKYREKLGITRYRCALDMGFGVSQGLRVKRIEESSITKTYKWSVFQYFVNMGRKLGYSDTKIINDILKKDGNE